MLAPSTEGAPVYMSIQAAAPGGRLEHDMERVYSIIAQDSRKPSPEPKLRNFQL